MSDITIRIDDDIQSDAQVLFERFGSAAGAVNSLIRRAIKEQQVTPIEAERKYNEYFNPHNMKILEESMAQSERGEVINFTLDELIAMETGTIPQRGIDFLEAHGKKVGEIKHD